MLLKEIQLTSYQKKGFGLYTIKKIPAGTIVWVPCKNCISIKASDLTKMEAKDREYLEDKAYYQDNGDLLMPDSISRFMNHSCDANILEYGLDFGVAIRDIEPNEEICSDYRRWLNDKEWNMECFCKTETCQGRISPSLGHDQKLKKFWRERVENVLPLITKVYQPMYDVIYDCSYIFKEIVCGEFKYLLNQEISIRKPKYKVYFDDIRYVYDQIPSYEQYTIVEPC